MSGHFLQERRAGVLLHPTSLPSGRLDGDAERWLDLLADAGISVWQVLPLGVTHEDHSPYQCLSAFAMSPRLFGEMAAAHIDAADFERWKESQHHWLVDFALFMIIREQQHSAPWYSWPDALRLRDPDALAALTSEYAADIAGVCEQQYLCHRRWAQIRDYARERGILLFGDMPIFVAYDSADIWANPDLFLLNDDLTPEYVAGVPPDYFSETGQRWGNPHFDWDQMQLDDFAWWMQRFAHHFDLFDLVRIDHFRGLEAVWMIPESSPTAVDGFWQKTSGDALLATLRNRIGELPLVAEDLGIITPEVVDLRKKYGLPGMAVLQFGFDEFDDNPHKPKNIENDTVVYTGTHDNNTTLGWYHSLDADVQQHVHAVLGMSADQDVVDTLIDIALDTPACLSILPMQDLLHLDEEARMNRPGTVEDNWKWRFDWGEVSPELVEKTRERLLASGRAGV
ncbi:MAG: 4-alpha-glucanotransferase [Chromatiales bacterium]|jgi:4-alpha-glucanotransferase